MRKCLDTNDMAKIGHEPDVGPTLARISEWLRAARERAGLARRPVSVRLDVSEKTVERWEDPDNPSLPPAHQFLDLVVFYKADVLELLAKRFKAGGAGQSAPERKSRAG